MTTLLDYARQQFPGRSVEVRAVDHEPPAGDVPLTSHTLVAQVVGRHRADDAMALLHDITAEHETVAAVVVRPAEAPAGPAALDAREGVADLRNVRIVWSAVAGAVAAAIIGFVAGAAASDNAWVPWVSAFFFAQAGGMVASIWGGGARHASQTAVTQPQVPGEPVTLVAALVHDERRAEDLARQVTQRGEGTDVRIVSDRGGWYAPSG